VDRWRGGAGAAGQRWSGTCGRARARAGCSRPDRSRPAAPPRRGAARNARSRRAAIRLARAASAPPRGLRLKAPARAARGTAARSRRDRRNPTAGANGRPRGDSTSRTTGYGRPGTRSSSGVDDRVDRLRHLAGAERNAAHEVEPRRIDEEVGPDELHELPEVDLGHEDLLVAAHDLARIPRERVEVAQVR